MAFCGGVIPDSDLCQRLLRETGGGHCCRRAAAFSTVSAVSEVSSSPRSRPAASLNVSSEPILTCETEGAAGADGEAQTPAMVGLGARARVGVGHNPLFVVKSRLNYLLVLAMCWDCGVTLKILSSTLILRRWPLTGEIGLPIPLVQDFEFTFGSTGAGSHARGSVLAGCPTPVGSTLPGPSLPMMCPTLEAISLPKFGN